MPTSHIAQQLAQRGRNGDSMLMHVSPEELHGLQALAVHKGTSLTINPSTGLPEAFSLKSLLPALAGLALGPAGFGLMSALGAAATVGGITALSSGDLGKGLMAGLGAYGGSSLGEGIMGMGSAATTAANPGLSSLSEVGAATPNAVATTGGFPSAWGATQAGAQAAFNDPSKILPALGGGEQALKTVGMAAAPVLADQMVPTATKMPTSNYNPGYIRTYRRDPATGALVANTPIKANEWGDRNVYSPEPFAVGGLTALASGGVSTDQKIKDESRAAYDYLMGIGDYPGRTDYLANSVPYIPLPKIKLPTELAPADIAAAKYAATTYTYGGGGDGGTGASSASGDAAAAAAAAAAGNAAVGAVGDSAPAPGAPVGSVGDAGDAGVAAGAAAPGDAGVAAAAAAAAASGDAGAAAPGDGGGDGGGAGGGDGGGAGAAGAGEANGGLLSLPHNVQRMHHLGSYSDGGQLLRGPGDGISDSIPATIGQHQPARLADGEFVVPARIVSELGNGSTEAGARALYKMMDRIQAARGRTIGKNKVAANSNAAKYLPA